MVGLAGQTVTGSVTSNHYDCLDPPSEKEAHHAC
jgi:hypothetical protein